MIRLNHTIRLTAAERRVLDFNVMERAEPTTIEDDLAWLDHARDTVWADDTPEEKLMCAMIDGARRDAEQGVRLGDDRGVQFHLNDRPDHAFVWTTARS